ncbi:DUF6586 family protein [Aurantivibrio plasticivorans]
MISTLVNQRLAFVRVQLRTAEPTPDPDIEQRLRQHAALDAAILQLHKAIVFFLAELSGESKPEKLLALPENIGSVIAYFCVAHPHSKELQEWQKLSSQTDSWLSLLISLERDPQHLGSFLNGNALSQPVQTSATPSLIASTSLDTRNNTDGLSVVKGLLSEAQSLIDAQRIHCAEE